MLVLLYDGHCRFCRRAARRLADLAGDRLTIESFQEPGVLDRYPQVSHDECMREMKLVLEDGRVEGGPRAVATALREARSARWRAMGALLGAPGVGALAGPVYRGVALARYGLGGSDCPEGACARHGGDAAAFADLEGDLRPTARLFLRALGLIYVCVFLSLAGQARVLVGADGLLPVREFLAPGAAAGWTRFLQAPTLFWLWDGDAAVRGGPLLGVALGLGLALGFRPKTCLVGLWLLFLSYVTVGRDFFWFQWDSLLLESSALALLLPVSPAARPHPWVVFLFRWLAFRLLFESGIAKVQQGAESWYQLTAMAWYYETAPLPSLGGWLAHQLPLWAHRWTTALTLFGELLGPLLIWGSRPFRRVAFILIVGFQVGIEVTANYGYFNVLSAAVALFLLDARDLRRLPRWLVGSTAPLPPGAPAPRRPLVASAAAIIFVLTLVEMLVLLAGAGVQQSPPLVALRGATQPFRFANKYHLFAQIDPRRIEPEIEWTADGEQWRAYQFRYKPGPLDRRPPIVAPHQPRVDFQLWFFTLGRDGGRHAYFNTLIRRLCASPDSVRELFEPGSFPDRPPSVIRLAYHRYRMTDLETLRREGRYWSRELAGYHRYAHFCDSAATPRF